MEQNPYESSSVEEPEHGTIRDTSRKRFTGVKYIVWPFVIGVIAGMTLAALFVPGDPTGIYVGGPALGGIFGLISGLLLRFVMKIRSETE